ncbi:MAG: PD-(D/E)XK nuclease family protein [Photobacterium frigidiphilum]|uniref:PD-(D/E)XK nuclease family protein n=1 Tax=Photobacterium frigidiphilum TaxID=264736 RepID=UPI003001FEB2
MSNYVNVVGYQLEKVHTGVIKWCLESQGKLTNIQAEIFDNLYSRIGKVTPFDKDEVQKVNCTPEYSFGRKVRIDLLIEIVTTSSSHYISCEMKVDSDPYQEQLDQIVNRVTQEFPDAESSEYILVLLGSSVVMRNIGDNHKLFNVISNRDLIDVFSNAQNESYIISEWIDALVEEVKREECILTNFNHISGKGLWEKSEHIALGYRPYFSTYYYLYSEMRKSSSMQDSWCIYSGGNNPVMNLSSHWKAINNFEFYWEFNYLEFCFKVHIDKNKMSHDALNALRDLLYPVLEKISYKGFPSQKRYGDWNTIFKWKFDVSEQSHQEIFDIIENKILPIYEEITNVAIDVLQNNQSDALHSAFLV